ncbi:MAG: PepSY domain-containing protein [Steroidobacteraceae bacterium]
MKLARIVLVAMALAIAGPAWSADAPATPTCNSGPQSGWKSKDALKLHLVKQTLAVKQVKIVGDCYAVYAVTHIGQPANGYYHPVTLKLVGPIPN